MEAAITSGGLSRKPLFYVAFADLERIRNASGPPHLRAAAFADACRINALYMIRVAGSGHVGTSFSCMDILSWLHLEVLAENDRYFSSKGHDAPALYSILIGLGRLDFALIHDLRALGGLPGHPDVTITPEVNTSTGSLGMGISKAKGFLLADRALERAGSVYVLLGDGELQEGQIWESLLPMSNQGLDRVTAIVDHNKIQSDTWVSEVSDLGDLGSRIKAFGWALESCDGNDVASLDAALQRLAAGSGDQPRMLIANTVKGAGFEEFEPRELPRESTALYPHHSGAPEMDQYGRAVSAINGRLSATCAQLDLPAPVLVEATGRERTDVSVAFSSPAGVEQRLIEAYGAGLVEAAEGDDRIVALDADLVLDCGLVPFRERHPDRFFECGIAEQDMVSTAGAMALSGLTPVVHSFACFLSSRPNEQIHNNATEGTKVIYAGSLAGLVPGGPGHSHQSVRDISALGAMPGMALLEPFSEHETGLVLRWALEKAPGPVYIRLVSVPWALPFDPPAAADLEQGRGTRLRDGPDGLIVASGPVMVSQAWLAADTLAERGLEVGVLALPWLRQIDGEWLAELAADRPIWCLDNHYIAGGQGEAVLGALAATCRSLPPVHLLGVESVPVCGSNDAVLRAHGLDARSVARRIAASVP